MNAEIKDDGLWVSPVTDSDLKWLAVRGIVLEAPGTYLLSPEQRRVVRPTISQLWSAYLSKADVCCMAPNHCGGECTCGICAPNLAASDDEAAND